ncbi:riboflavin synthase [Calditerricola satsumensis]|uniref:Riboflavin synthase n=1 Tax=Calditerricola satsumensis TaxID=373054 RepID=A0A8J3F8T7_9BACI|nr:riboflavin synthase [Calditerricola satsumensis]GGJ94394.1 riboflavin synthase subunit alpha [Calditerricola satsumensis]
MFTGIIEEVGRVRRLSPVGPTSMVLEVEARSVLEDARVGDSIAVNGVCLTVTALGAGTFTADVMPETVKKTSLARLKPGALVNLERAMAAGARFGGHIVTGHVDGVGVIRSRTPRENAVVFAIDVPDDLRRYLIPKGSVAVDGISLTVVDVTETGFTVSIIPHTLANTVLRHLGPGDLVNIECDVIAKYVERFVQRAMGVAPAGGEGADRSAGLTLAKLTENGFA